VPPDFRGKTVLVTGVGRVGQVGHAVAQALGKAGANLVIADMNATAVDDRARELAQSGVAVRGAAGDLTKSETARSAVALASSTFGGLDALINVAGGFTYFGSTLDAAPEILDRELTINLKTAFVVAQAALPALLARGGGSITNFASAAVLRGDPQMAPYLAAKSGVAGLTRGLAREFGPRGVRVNAVAPGTLRTADNQRDMREGNVQWVELADLVAVVLFLASDEARAVSGAIIPVGAGAF